MSRLNSLLLDSTPLHRNRSRADVLRITHLALVAVILFDLAGAGTIFAIGEVHARHPEISLIDLH